MKILLAQSAVYVPTHGGENKANRLLLEALARRGHGCRVLAPAAGVQAARSEDLFLEELARREIPLSATSPRSFSFEAQGVAVSAVRDSSTLPAAFAEEIRSFAPDRILVSSEDPGHGLLQAAAEADPSRTVYLAHTMLFFPFGPNSFARSHAMTEAFRRLGGVITVSAYLQRYIREWGGREAAVIPFPAFGAGPFPRLGRFDDGTVTFINPCAYKGITVFLELARRMPDVAFAAVPSWGTTPGDLAALERRNNVQILPARDDLDTLLEGTRALLVPSLWAEGFPLVPVEAMLRGIPVLASDSGGLPEAKLGVPFVLPVRPIEKYTDRFDAMGLPIAIVPEQDVDPWRAALRSLLSDRSRYEQLASESRSAAEEYAGRLSAGPFESYLEELPGASAPRRVPPRARPEAGREEIRRRLEHLTPEKRALLVSRLRKTPTAETDRVPRRNANDEQAVSFAQERLWFLDRMNPGSSAYLNVDAFRLVGPLDAAALEAAMREVARRHEVFRTTFVEIDGRARLAVASEPEVSVPVLLDLQGVSEENRESAARDVMRAEARAPFDLERGPTWRARLLRLRPDEHVFVITTSHLISDGWSFGVLQRELTALYRGFSSGRPSSLPEPPIQYADYARWQRDRYTAGALEAEMAYWKERLGGEIPLLRMPGDRERPLSPSFAGSRVERVIPPGLTEGLRALSRAEGATLFMTLLAAYQALLFRYSGQPDVWVGTPIAGRSRTETEGLIGFLVNTLVLRGDLSGDPTFRELLRQVRHRALEAYEHQEVPFEKLVEALRPDRDTSASPLFQTMFTLQNAPRGDWVLDGLEVRPIPFHNGTAKFDLTLDVTERREGLVADLEYSADLFDRATAERILKHWAVLLESAVAHPDASLSRLALLTSEEQAEVLARGERGGRLRPGRSVPQLFESRAALRAEAVAVVCEGEQWTYGEINRRANQLARRLRALGVGPEVRVGLCLGRSVDLVVAILGVLKAGGAYVPLDPEYPAERVSFLLQDSGVAVLVTREGLAGALPAPAQKVLRLDADAGAIESEASEDLPASTEPGNAAYVIYTSGSTGTPKGVVVTHENVARLFQATEELVGFREEDVWTLFHSYAFDFSVWEIWGALLYGGRLVVVPYWTSRSPEEFRELLSRERVTVLNITPSVFAQLSAADGQSASPLVLRMVIFGGEALAPSSLRDWVLRHGADSPRLVNMYGITETTVHVTERPISEQDVAVSGTGSVIGRPLSDLRVRLLDPNLQLVPVGVPGEMYIGGGGVARGYWNRPELTAQRFVPDPFPGAAGDRLYRSGDLARYREDGDLEYLGRADRQVKVRGFRIEPGEIETRLREHPEVREAVVLARSDAGGRPQLVAYLVAGPQAVSEEKLRTHLKQRLPDYMVPSAFMWLPKLPLTPNGKIDTRALPAPSRAAPQPGTAAAPQSPLEEMVAGIFADVLGRERVGREEDFFALGGHSLLVTQVVSRVADSVGIRLPLRRVFEAPTVAGLSLALSEQSPETAPAGGRPHLEALRHRGARSPREGRIEPVARDGPIPLSFPQQGLWFLDQLEPNNPFYNLLLSIPVSGALDVAALEKSLGEIVRRHEALRTVFPTVNGHPVQSILPAAPMVLPARHLDRLQGKQQKGEVERHAAEEVKRPFDLTRGPLLRATLLRLGEEEHLLLLTMHHIVCDGWSIDVLLRELAAVYAAFSRGLPSPLAPLPIQYADYAVWQRRELAGEGLQQRLAYWTRKLEGSPLRLDLRMAHSRPAVMDHRGEIRRFEIPRDLSDAIKALSRRERVTLFMTLVAAFQALLAHAAGQEDVVIGTDVANRSEVEVEGLIGHFVNQVVLRVDLSGDPSFLELLRRVREVTLEAYANQDAPFDKVVEAVRPERSLSYSPLFQVKLVLQAAPVSAPESFPWTTSALEVHSGMVKFDLLMSLWDTGTALGGTIEYATALFDAATIDRLLEDFRSVLGRVVSDPRVRWSELRDFLTEEEWRRQLRRNRDLKDVSLQKVAGARRKAVFAEAETEEVP